MGFLYLLSCWVVAPNLLTWGRCPIGRGWILSKSITKYEFLKQLNEVYCPRESWWLPWLKIEESRVRILKAGLEDYYDLQFSESNQSGEKSPKSFQISGSRILIDPGHIGGKFSEMEGRHFAIGDDKPVKEGDLALSVALLLRSSWKKRSRS